MGVIHLKILLAEDEKDLSNALVAVLSHSGYDVTAVFDGEAAETAAHENAFDCFIFDIMMPKKDGVTALTEIRKSGDMTPALFLTAKAEMDDKVTGLDAGADDYLTKPFAMAELMARIRSMTRRRETYNGSKIVFGSVTLNLSEQELKSENSVRLASKESKLMELFMRSPGKAFTTDEIYQKVWKDEKEDKEDKEDSGVVWVYVSYLRTKLSSIDANLRITGNQGESYMLIKTDEA